MVRCSRSGMGKLPNGVCVVFIVWRLLAIHVSGIFHHDMFHYVHFILTSGCWEILDSEKCRKKKDTQTTDGRIVAVSFILGPPGLQTHVFSQPSSGNCNLFVLMLFPLGPAFIMSHSLTIEFQLFVISHAIYDHHNHYFFLLGVSPLLVGALGRFLFLIAGVCKGVRRMKKSSEIRAQAVAAQQTWKIVFNILNQI